jgi:glyceraldehyde-3-phosphate dehydrogenase/erythrose-4-phosphate dehydrogenase
MVKVGVVGFGTIGERIADMYKVGIALAEATGRQSGEVRK